MKPLYLITGKSGSGKTTIVNYLEETYGLRSLQSYTTRPPRYEGEVGHIFVTDEEFDALENIVAYTDYNNYRYCATAEQVDEVDLYVVDVPGVEYLLDRYSNAERRIHIIYLDTTVKTRIQRMIDRGDSDSAIVGRLLQDEEYDWYRALARFSYLKDNVETHGVYGEAPLEIVIKEILHIIKEE